MTGLYVIANAMEQLAKDLRRAAAAYPNADIGASVSLIFHDWQQDGAVKQAIDALCAETGTGPATERRMHDDVYHYSPPYEMRSYHGIEVAPIASVEPTLGGTE